MFKNNNEQFQAFLNARGYDDMSTEFEEMTDADQNKWNEIMSRQVYVAMEKIIVVDVDGIIVEATF
jgi:spore germination protein YaaH